MLERYSTSGVSVGSLKMGQRAVIPHQRGFPARGRVPELLLAVPTHRTWWQGPGCHHHHLPLPAGDQQTAVPSRAAPGPGAALPLGGTVSAGGSFLPQTDAAMSQSFPAGANKPLLHLCQACVCPFHALLSPLKVIFPSIIHFFSPRKKNSVIFPSSLPALYPNSPFLRRYQPKAVPQGELSQRRLRRIPPPPSFTPATSHSQLRYPDNFYLLSLTPLHSTSPSPPHVRSRAAQHPYFFLFFRHLRP